MFQYATQLTDRFHVQKLINEAVQDIRVQKRCKALDTENTETTEGKKKGKHIPHLLRLITEIQQKNC